MKTFLEYDKTDKIRYVSQNFDCDDFAKVLMANHTIWCRQERVQAAPVFGVVYGRRTLESANSHAMNFVLLFDPENEEKPVVKFVEPQNDSIVSCDAFASVYVCFY